MKAAQSDEHSEEDARRAAIGRRFGVRDHEEGEEEERAVLDLVDWNGEPRSEPERAAEKDRAVAREERKGDVGARGAVHHEAAEACEEERGQRSQPGDGARSVIAREARARGSSG